MHYGYIYKITNRTNGKIYIGQKKGSTVVPSYWGSGVYISSAIKKYGLECFTREILEWCDTREVLSEREKFWIAEFKSNIRGVGYNLTSGGDGTSGYRWSNESRAKLSASRSGDGNPWYGKHLSEEHRTKIGVASSRQSEETRLKRSLALSGENNPMYGKTHSIETREYISKIVKEKMSKLQLKGRVYHHTCKNCGKPFTSNGSNSKWCTLCNPYIK